MKPPGKTLTPELLHRMDAYWRAASYLSVGQIYLYDNPLLKRPLSFPGGIPSHASPECPGSIHEGGELGYSLSHSFGVAFDNPDFVVACVVGDGEAETGPLATAWHSNKFLDPVTDGGCTASWPWGWSRCRRSLAPSWAAALGLPVADA